MKRLVFILVLVTSILMLQSGSVQAEGSADGAVRKLGRGLVNVLTGWGEVFTQTSSGMAESEGVQGFFVGLGKGVVWTVLREAAGVYETVTFVLPWPNDYAPLMDPPTLLQ